MRLTAKTDVGKVRAENQDDYRASIQSAEYAWAAVCDGMGGANGGMAASGIAVTVAENRCSRIRPEEMHPDQLRQSLKAMVDDANAQVYEASQKNPELHGMGTTMVIALVVGKMCVLASVGDSRLYLYRGGALQQITKDHSMVQDLVDKGVITPDEALMHPQRNVITRAVGIQPYVEVDLFQISLQSQDILLLCSDGLTNALSVDKIEGILASTAFYDSANCLIKHVLGKEEQDNTTVVLLAVD